MSLYSEKSKCINRPLDGIVRRGEYLDQQTVVLTKCVKVGCLGDGTRRVGPCQDGMFYRIGCECATS